MSTLKKPEHKPCTTCKHKVRGWMGWMEKLVGTEFAMCQHQSLPVDPVSGEAGQRYCSNQRSSVHPCGPEGRLHE